MSRKNRFLFKNFNIYKIINKYFNIKFFSINNKKTKSFFFNFEKNLIFLNIKIKFIFDLIIFISIFIIYFSFIILKILFF